MQDLVNAIVLSFNFVFSNIHVAGWIALIFMAWKASSKWSKFTDGVTAAEKVAQNSEQVLTTVATNHLPHLQESMNNVEKNLEVLRVDLIDEIRGLRSDLLQYALRK